MMTAAEQFLARHARRISTLEEFLDLYKAESGGRGRTIYLAIVFDETQFRCYPTSEPKFSRGSSGTGSVILKGRHTYFATLYPEENRIGDWVYSGGSFPPVLEVTETGLASGVYVVPPRRKFHRYLSRFFKNGRPNDINISL